MGNSDSKNGSPNKRPSQTKPTPAQTRNDSLKRMELAQLKQEVIKFIQKRIAEKGLKEFYAIEILEAVIPLAEYKLFMPRPSVFQYKFKWKEWIVTAESTNQVIAKRKAASAALLMMFEIKLPVYDPPENDALFQKNSYFVQFESQGRQGYRAFLTYESKTVEGFGETYNIAKNKLFDSQNVKFFQEFDSKPIRDICRKVLMSFVISETDPLEKRIQFIFKHLVTRTGDKIYLKPTTGVLTAQERKYFETIQNNMRTFYVFVSKSDVEEYTACVELNSSDMFRTRKSSLEAERDLMAGVFNVILRQREFQTSKVNDTVVAKFMRTYGSKEDTDDISVIKEKALNHAKSLLATQNTENSEAMWILHKTLNYISYCEHTSGSKIKSTILWKDKLFSACASDELLATLLASEAAVKELFQLPLETFIFNKDKARQELLSQIKFIPIGSWMQLRINIDDKRFEADTRFQSQQNAEDEIIKKALEYLQNKGIEKTIQENRKIIICALIKKDQPLLERIHFVITNMRAPSGFGPTDDVLTENERKFLLTIENKVTIEEKTDCFKAIININDNLISGTSHTKLDAKNQAILAAYMYIENVNKGRDSESKSPENRAIVSVKTNKSSEPDVKSSASTKTPNVRDNNAETDSLILYKERFEAYPKTDNSLKFPSIVWYKITKSTIPIETSEGEDKEFTSSIVYAGKIFKEKSFSSDKSKHKVAVTVMRQQLGVDSQFWSEFFEPENVKTVIDVKPHDDLKKKKLEAIESCKKQVAEYLKKHGAERLKPVDFWNHLSIPIKSEGNTSKIQFFDETFTVTDKNQLYSKRSVAVIAFEKLFGISFPQWNIYKTDLDDCLKIYKEKLEAYPKPDMNLKFPSIVWSKITNNEHPIETIKSGAKEFTSTIVYADKIFKEKSFDHYQARHKVACTAMRQLLGVDSEFWSVYFDSKENSPAQTKVVSTNTKEKLDAIQEYKKRSNDIIANKMQRKQMVRPVDVWHAATRHLYRIKTSKHFNGFLSEIQFFDLKVSRIHADEVESRRKVAIAALKDLLGVSSPDWDANKPQQTNPTQKASQAKSNEKSELEAVKLCYNRAKDYMNNHQKNLKNITPVELWNIATANKFDIKTIAHRSGGFLSEIEFFGKKFHWHNQAKEKSRNKAAAIALDTLLDIRLPHWSAFSGGTETNISSANSVSSLDSNSNEKKDIKQEEKQRITAVKIYQQRMDTLLNTDPNNWTPAKLWHALFQGKFDIKTTLKNNEFTSTVKFYDKSFCVKNNDEMLSRHLVAINAFSELFSKSLPYWKNYKQNYGKSGQSSSETSIVPKNENLNKDQIKVINIIKERASDILKRPHVKTSTIYPVDLWNGATGGCIKIRSTKMPTGEYVSIVEILGKQFKAQDAEESKSRHKVAAMAFQDILGISLPHWKSYKTSSTGNCLKSSSKASSVTSLNSTGSIVTTNEQKMQQIKMKVKDLQAENIDTNPTDFWSRISCGYADIESKCKNGKTDSTINYFGRVFSASHTDSRISRHQVAAIALSILFKVNYPQWKEYNPFGDILAKKKSTQENKSEDYQNEQENVAPESVVNVPSRPKISSEEITKILEELKTVAREIINNQDDISPTQLWNETVKDRSTYSINTEFHSKLEKYVSTIEFHDKIFSKADYDQVKAETMVACVALDELLGLEFDADDDECGDTTQKSMNESQSIVKAEDDTTEENICSESVTSSNETSEDILERIETPEPEPLLLQQSDSSSSSESIIYEPVTKRLQPVLEVACFDSLDLYHALFKQSGSPALTESEWELLKTIVANIFNVNMDQSESDDEESISRVLKSVVINDHQVFGSGETEEEAMNATIVSAFEHIEDEGLDINVDTIEVSKHFVADEDEEKLSLIQEVSCIHKLRDLLKSLQERKMCLDDVPCSEIFKTIGIDFNFEYQSEGINDPALERVKEMTARFAIKKLLDLAYDIDD